MAVTADEIQNRLYAMDVTLAREYAATVRGSSDSISELLLRLAATVESLVRENRQLRAGVRQYLPPSL